MVTSAIPEGQGLPAVALHVLGRADVGAHDATEYRARLARLEAGELDVLLQTRDGVQHADGPPIASLVHRCRRGGLEVRRIALIGTRLGDTVVPGRAGNDTERLARLVAAALAVRPDLYGAAATASVVTAHGLSEVAFRKAARWWLRRHGSGRVVVTMGGGPVEGFLGVLMGCLEAGVLPVVCVTNRAPGSSTDLVELNLEVRAKRWLARAGVFGALAELEPGRRWDWLFLAALARCDWAEAERIRADVSHHLVQALDLPPMLGQVPADASGWRFYRRLLEGIVARQVGAGEVSGLTAARAWPGLRAREVTAADGRDEAQLRPWSGRGYDGHVDRYVRDWKSGAVAAPGWLEQAAPRSRWTGAYEAARKLGHARALSSAQALAAARDLVAGDPGLDPISAGLDRLDHRSGPLLPGSGWLVVTCVSGPRLPAASAEQMLAALRCRLRGEGGDVLASSSLRLVASREAMELAAGIASDASPDFATVSVIGGVPIDNPVGCRDVVLDALRTEPGLDGVAGAIFACNPGTKAMNLGTALGVVEWSFEALRPFSIAPIGLTASGSELRLDRLSRPVMARLLNDRALARLLPGLVDRVELGLAARLSSLGSDHWDTVTRCAKHLRGLWLDRRPDGDRWFPARVELCCRLAATDPWRALHTFCALADQAWAVSSPGGGWTCPWRDGPGLEPCASLWERRRRSPLGHAFLGRPGDGAAIAGELRRAVGALLERGLVPAGHEPVGRLVDELAALAAAVRSVQVLPVHT